jgi:hypothetical protein
MMAPGIAVYVKGACPPQSPKLKEKLLKEAGEM